MSKTLHSIRIQSSTQFLEDVRRFVEFNGREAGLNDDMVERFKIAVDEACTNIIKHAYGGDESQEIEICTQTEPCCFTVLIRDCGRTFHPETYHAPDLKESIRNRRPGGYGVHIIRRLMDRVEYRTLGRVNEVALTMYREGVAPPTVAP